MVRLTARTRSESTKGQKQSAANVLGDCPSLGTSSPRLAPVLTSTPLLRHYHVNNLTLSRPLRQLQNEHDELSNASPAFEISLRFPSHTL